MSAPVQDALRRAAVYRVLAGAFAYPAPERLQEIRHTAATAAGIEPSPAVAGALRVMARAAGDGEAVPLSEAYVTLFERGTACPPYEGAYGVPQMSGKAAQLADIGGFYAAFAMASAEAQRDIEDHIGVELDFMAALALKEAWASAGGAGERFDIVHTAERAFLHDHLARWAEAFAARVVETPAPDFYGAAARLLAAWLRDECARLGVVPRPLGGPQPPDDGAAFTCPMAAGQDREGG